MDSTAVTPGFLGRLAAYGRAEIAALLETIGHVPVKAGNLFYLVPTSVRSMLNQRFGSLPV